MSFDSLGLVPELVRALSDRGYVEPTPIQARVIPEILQGRDILAGAQTGTGKTAAFTLPLLQKLSARSQTHRSPRALVLVPTRELATQVHESVRSYGKYLSWRTAVIFGGVSINPQIDALRRGVDIIVATPGRLLDHAEQRTIDLSRIEVLVLDEADRMLDMGFIHDIKRVLRLVPKERQNLMFSATYSDDIRKLAQSFLRNPSEIEVARRNTAVESVDQQAYMVPKDRKRDLLSHLIREGDWSQVLVFTRTKHGANRLAKQLEEDGIETAAIHGNKSQNARTHALKSFKELKVRALVATEVAARGLDIKELPHVVNYELPNVPEDYVHRIGRTGRAGATGAAISLVAPDENGLLRDIERTIRRRIDVLPLPTISMPTRKPRPAQDAAPSQSHQRQASQNNGHRGNASAQRSHGAGASSHQHSRGGNRPAQARGSRPSQPSRGQQRQPQRSRRPS